MTTSIFYECNKFWLFALIQVTLVPDSTWFEVVVTSIYRISMVQISGKYRINILSIIIC